MNNVYLGYICGTHGIIGEVKIKSTFKEKELVFKVGNNIIIENHEYEITRYRYHKIYDMVTLKDYNNINDVLSLVGKKVYINRDAIDADYILEDVIGMDAYFNGELLGKVVDYFDNSGNIVLNISAKKEIMVPYNKNFIKEIKKIDNKIEFMNIEGLI